MIIFILIYIFIGIITYNSFLSLLPSLASIFYTVIVNVNNVKYLNKMGASIIIEGRKILNNKKLNKEVHSIASDYVTMQEENVETLKKYL